MAATQGSRGSIGKCELNLYAEEGRSSMKMKGVRMPKLPKQLTSEEKKYLLAVERSDLATVRRILQKAIREGSFDINCVDPLGRGALLMAIEGENLAMVELLVVMGVRTADALLHAIDLEFVEAVELLLEHEELIHKEGELYSWENIDRDTATFTPEITPLILAAHRNNYEIVKILLDRGATLPMPHDIRCGCNECIEGARQDCLRHSASRINSYKALASPSLIALTSTDPLLTAFELSWELKQLSFSEPEFRGEYLELRKRSQEFAVALLGHTRTSHELQVMLNFDPNIMKEDDESVSELEPTDIHEGGLARLRLAINYKQKKFVAHSWVQQLLASIWYDGLPGFRQKGAVGKATEVAKVILFAPFYCLLYMLAPNSQTGRLIRKPFMKFLIQTSSYLFFLLLLILVSQRVEEQLVEWLESLRMRDDPNYLFHRKQHRGLPPRFLEILVVMYLIGFIWEEARELAREGIRTYVTNMWNAIDFLRNFTYVIVFFLRGLAFFQQRHEIALDPEKAYIPREDWDDYDPQLIAEGLFAAANIFSALKLVHTSSINPHLGPLQISLGRMIVDILKFFFFYSLVLFAFACGLNQLLWYFADLEKDKCYCLPGGAPDWKNNAEACMKWRRFGNLFESSQSLFWASFGMVGLSDFELTGIKSYTRFWGLLMFGSYSVINVIVLLNLLIAMMSNSYAMITEKADTEWKFARTKLWLSYFDEDSTLPSPFNLIPTPKQIKRLLGRVFTGSSKGKSSSKAKEARLAELREQAREYTAVMRALVWRYISGMHRTKEEESIVTEDDVNEIKGEISSLRCDLVEVFRNNGMNVNGLSKEMALSKKTREWERRLFRGFHVAPAAGDDSILLNVEAGAGDDRRESETGADKFKRMARLALLNRERLARPPKHLSHIGRSTSSESFKSRQSLKKAMEAAKKMTEKSKSPVPPSPEPGQTLEENKMVKSSDGECSADFKSERKESMLSVVAESRTITPTPSIKDGASVDETVESADDDRPPSAVPPPPPVVGGEVSLMDEPLPENVNLAKPTSPLQQTKALNKASPDEDNQKIVDSEASPTPSAKHRELSRVSKSVPELTELVQSENDEGSRTKICMENETKAVGSPLRAPSRLSAKSGSLDINAELKKEASPHVTPEQARKLSRDPTLEMDSVAVVGGSSSTSLTTRIDVPYVQDVTEDDDVPLIKEEQETSGGPEMSTSVSIPSSPTPPPLPSSSKPIVPIVTNTTNVGPRLDQTFVEQRPSSSSSHLTIMGQKIDDVKTIKRPKPGGAWF